MRLPPFLTCPKIRSDQELPTKFFDFLGLGGQTVMVSFDHEFDLLVYT